MPNAKLPVKTDTKEPSAKIKGTVTYHREQKFKQIMYFLADEVFSDSNLPDLELNLKHNARYKTLKQLSDDVKLFFRWCGDYCALPTVNSLSLFLGWYPELFYNYIKVEGCSYILKRAQALMAYRLEISAEETGNPGAMFLLKASHGYREQSIIEVNVNLDVPKLFAKALSHTSRDTKELDEVAMKKIDQVYQVEDNKAPIR